MKASICLPTWALMFRLGSALVKTLAKMLNITVATAEATMVTRAVKKLRIKKGKERSQMKVRRRCGGLERPTWVPLLAEYAAAQALMVCGGREETAKGLAKIMTKLSTAPVRKRPNIQWEATLARCRGFWISVGSPTVRGCR